MKSKIALLRKLFFQKDAPRGGGGEGKEGTGGDPQGEGHRQAGRLGLC